jgi:hypothetical protein
MTWLLVTTIEPSPIAKPEPDECCSAKTVVEKSPAKMAIAAKNIARIEYASIRAPHPAQRFC